MSNTIFLVMLASLLWPEIVKRLDLEERTENIGDGETEDGYRYSVIKQRDRISIILPDYPEEGCEEAAKRIVKKLVREEKAIQILGYHSTFCNYCLCSTFLPYKCHRCGGWYCKDHRLPEEHNCPGGEGSLKSSRVKASEPEEAESEEPLVVLRSSCG